MVAGRSTSLVSGGRIRGWKASGAFEMNQTSNVEVRDLDIWAGNSNVFNINGSGSLSRRTNSLFKNVNVDMTHVDPAMVGHLSGMGGASVTGGDGWVGTKWQNYTFNTGDASHHLAGFSNFGRFIENDFSTSTVTGSTSWGYYWPAAGVGTNKMPAVN